MKFQVCMTRDSLCGRNFHVLKCLGRKLGFFPLTVIISLLQGLNEKSVGYNCKGVRGPRGLPGCEGDHKELM